ELSRAESLAGGEAAPIRTLEDARTAAELAGAEVTARVAELEKLVGGARGHELAAAAAQHAEAEAAVARLEDLLRDRVLAAPVSGSVLHRLAEPGEVARAAAPLLVLGDLSRPWVDVYVPEPRVGEVIGATRVEVRVDAWPGRVFAGAVRHVASEAEFTPKNVQVDDQRARLVFRVRVEVGDPDGLLRPGMPAQVFFAPAAAARPAEGPSAARAP
uniref:HlyD family secretion protein n=1 Tax=Anaeromyxobacter terrae TaxID=2925406 RepID=UPI001F56D909